VGLMIDLEVDVGQVWLYRGTDPYLVASVNDSRESLGSWVMTSIPDGRTIYMHKQARLRGKWVKAPVSRFKREPLSL